MVWIDVQERADLLNVLYNYMSQEKTANVSWDRTIAYVGSTF
jgi:hypothetical protein